MTQQYLESKFALSGSRIVIRGFGDAELYSDEYLVWCNNFDVIKQIGRDDYNLPVNRKMLIEYVTNLNPRNTSFMAIYYLENGKEKLVGTIKLYDINYISRRASIGIMIGDESVWGKGLGTEAIELVCKHVFEKLYFNKVTAGYQSNNLGMAKAFKKAGFIVEGTLVKHTYTNGDLQDIVLVAKHRELA